MHFLPKNYIIIPFGSARGTRAASPGGKIRIMIYLLLAVIYLTFISLGLPDSVFGAVWPVAQLDFGVSGSLGSLYTTLTGAAGALAGFFAGRLINKFGTYAVTAVSVALTAVGLLLISFTTAFWQMLAISVVMGLGSGAIDTGLNTFVSEHYGATHMNLLHCFWGVGVMLSPIIMSVFIGKGDWQKGYIVLASIQFAIFAVVAASFPMWKKFASDSTAEIKKKVKRKVKEILRSKGVLLSIFSLGLYCAAEFTVGTWGASYLVNARHIPEEKAALGSTAFYGGLMLGRLIAGILAIKLSDKALIRAGLVVAIPGVVLLAIPAGMWGAYLALAVIGVGMGPIFPSVLHTVPARFGTDSAAEITGYHMGGAYIVGFAVQLSFGFLAGKVGYEFMAYLLLVIVALTIFVTELVAYKMKKVSENVE